MRSKTNSIVRAAILAVFLLAANSSLADSIVSFSLSTQALAADAADQPFSLQFLLLPGTDGTTNTVTVSNFQFGTAPATTGSAGAVQFAIGDVSGDATTSVTLSDDAGTAALIQNFTPGDTLSFQISTTANLGANDPVYGNIPDDFTFQILDSSFNPIPTTDPNAVTFLSISYGNPALDVESAGTDPLAQTTSGATLDTGDPVVVSPTASVPLPTTWALGLPLLLITAIVRRRRRRLSVFQQLFLREETMRFRTAMFSLVSLSALAQSASAQLIAPDQPVAGKSQLSLAEEYCRWNIEQPVETNPTLDNTGAQAFRGDQGSVFFLAGDLTASPIVRTISVPAGEPLFIPIDGATNDNTAPAGQPPTNYTAAELLSALTPLFDPANEAHFLQIDGVSQPNMYAYRQTTNPSAPFSYTTTSSDNYIDQITGSDTTLGTGVFPSTVFPVVEDGYWAALQPFAPGSTHTVRFGFESGGFGADITYVITTVPEPTTTTAATLVLCMAASWRRAHRGRQ